MNRLEEIRKDRDLNQTQVGLIIGKGQTTVSEYEIETRGISIESLIKLAKYYNTSVDYLLYRTDVRQPYPKPVEVTKIEVNKEKIHE